MTGTAIELGMQRHWKTAVQLIPWYTLAVTAAGVALLVVRFVSAVFGVYEHVRANHDAGPLDFRYTNGVGPSPPLTPAVLAHAALCRGAVAVVE